MPDHRLRLIECKPENQQRFILRQERGWPNVMIKGVSVSTQKRAQKLSCAIGATEKGKAGGPDFQAQFDKSAGQASGDQKFRNR